jgi:hypothetical protein
MRLYIKLIFILSGSHIIFTQSIVNHDDKDLIKWSNIKALSVWEFHFVNDAFGKNGNEPVLRDSGYKSFHYEYDKDGKLTMYTKYHIFSDLTIREMYQYNKFGILDNTTRYNSAGDRIETVEYKFNSLNKLKSEIHTAYYNPIRPGVYFTIIANVNDDSLFGKLQDDLEIEPRISGYTITANISDPDEENQYIVIGDESDPTSPRYSWSQLSLESQRGLLAWTGPNKKEHTYITKNIALVNYRYGKKGNIIAKEVYNTANDLIEKESYMYNGNNYKIGHYKYSEKGKLSSMETYIYDSTGRVTETDGLNPDGKLVSRLIYKYDDYNNQIEKLWVNPNGEINGRFVYNYDISNQLFEEIKYLGESEKESRQVFKYDNYGNLSEIILYNINNEKEKLTKYVYEYY